MPVSIRIDKQRKWQENTEHFDLKNQIRSNRLLSTFVQSLIIIIYILWKILNI